MIEEDVEASLSCNLFEELKEGIEALQKQREQEVMEAIWKNSMFNEEAIASAKILHWPRLKVKN